MIRSLRLIAAVPVASVGIIGLCGLGLSSGAYASTSKAPNCSTVSVATLKAALGGSPSKPKSETQNGTLSCNYGTSTISYRFKQTSTLFGEARSSQAGTKVSGIGSSAYSSSLSGLPELSVLAGSVAFSISGTETDLLKDHPVTLSSEEKLAKKIVPLAK